MYEGNIGGERQTSSFHIVGPASTEVPLQAEFRVDENGLVSMTAARQQVVDSMKPFSKASFKTKLPGKNGILSEAIGYADEWRHMFVLIEPSSGKIHEPLKANKTLETTLDGQTEVEIQVTSGSVKKVFFLRDVFLGANYGHLHPRILFLSDCLISASV